MPDRMKNTITDAVPGKRLGPPAPNGLTMMSTWYRNTISAPSPRRPSSDKTRFS